MNDIALDSGLQVFHAGPQEYDFTTAKAEALFAQWVYGFQWVLDEYEVIALEFEFTFPLVNPETGAESRSFTEAGKMDGILRHKVSREYVLLEHKTTSETIEPGSDYWQRLIMDSQISKYLLACRAQGMEVRNVLYDVIAKPAQRPSLIPLRDSDGLKIVVDSNGNRVFSKDGKKPRETGDFEKGYVLQTRPETPGEYRDRIIIALRQNHGRHFVQKVIPRSDSDLLEYMGDAWATSKQILNWRAGNLWPRNPQACQTYGTCEYFELCSGRASVDGIRYANKGGETHPELATIKSGADLLTNSRIRALRKCPRYHQLRYERGVFPVEQASEALTLGTLFHSAVEAYLSHFIQHNNP